MGWPSPLSSVHNCAPSLRFHRTVPAVEGWRAELARLSGAGIATLLSNSGGVAPPPMAPLAFEFDAFDATSARWLDAAQLRELASAAVRSGVLQLGLASVSPALGDLPPALLQYRPDTELATDETSSR